MLVCALVYWNATARALQPIHSGPIDAMAVANAPPARLGLGSTSPTPGAPLVYVAAGPGEIGLWDVAAGSCLQVSAEDAIAPGEMVVGIC